MKIPFIDLKTQFRRLQEPIKSRIDKVLQHGQFVMGPEVYELEEKLAEFSGARYAISCSSGTDALLMSLMAYQVGPGDAIFVPSFTFIATAEVVPMLGATPVFVDIDPYTYNMDPKQLELAVKAVLEPEANSYPLPRQIRKKGIQLKPKGIIGVDLFGLPAEYKLINSIAKKYNLFVIEDAAQSFGALYYDKKSGTVTDIGCTSFFPAKPLGGYGDGGAVFTNDYDLAQEILSIRIHGQDKNKYDCRRIGLNARLDTFQAAVLLEKLQIFSEEIEKRKDVAEEYTKNLSSYYPKIVTPYIPAHTSSTWAQYSIQVQERRELCDFLYRNEIPTNIYYEVPLHQQTAFSNLGYQSSDLPVTEAISQNILSLPMHPYLSQEQIDKIVNIIFWFYQS